MRSKHRHHWPAALFVLLLVAVMAVIPTEAKTPSPPQRVLDDAPPEFTNQFLPRHSAPLEVTKRPGLYSAEDWATAIDSTWGSGLPWSSKLTLWNVVWNTIDQSFACFHGLDSSLWDSIWSRYDAEIQDTVSRGRFCAIMQYASMALFETHTVAQDTGVSNTAAAPGVPIMYVGDWGWDDRFGAALTPLADSSLLVYQVAPDQPLGLVPGDRVLGYDGVPWKDLMQDLLGAELPLTGGWRGSSQTARNHGMLAAAGRNFHLFDTIDVVKYATGDTVHFATGLLAGGTTAIYNTEQLDVPGVTKPDPWSGQWASWGIITGTHIGYIYVQGWLGDVQTQFYNAVDSLMHRSTTTGLIIDFRLNYGGNMFLAYPGLGLLFKDTVRSVTWFTRCNPSDRFSLCPSGPLDQATIYPDTNTYYNKPIAVLTGPGAVSSGDQIALRMAYHPMARFFGKPTDGAFNSPVTQSLHPDWYFRYALHDPALFTNPGHYLTHDRFPSPEDYPWVPYNDVWLTPDGVASGRDDVVDSAVAWILSRDVDGDGVVNELDNCPNTYNPAQEDLDSNGVGDSCECNVVVIDVTGDVNVSGSITSADIIGLVNYVFKSGAEPMPCVGAGDVNCSGNITSADIIGLVNYVFKSGTPPCDVCTLIPATWTCP